ncbi:MAG: hypothetical protein GC160_22350 [Acidobacteria bacterium]|nr:hypothetical protein [Acidobacteriota bacterium]
MAMTFGSLLIALGVGGWALTGQQSPTALIPAGFGVVLFLLGWLARKESLRMHAMHGAATVALLGLFGSAHGLMQLPALLSGEAERPAAVIAQTVMAALCTVFVLLCVQSFVAARKARQAGA